MAASLLAVATLSACATATPYQPNIAVQPGRAAPGGFSEQRVEPDRYRVSFAGNSLTSRETVESYLLYRAAELTAAQGYDWFTIADRQTDRKARTYAQADPFYNSWYGSHFGHFAPSWLLREPSGYPDHREIRGHGGDRDATRGQARRRSDSVRRPRRPGEPWATHSATRPRRLTLRGMSGADANILDPRRPGLDGTMRVPHGTERR